MCYPNCKGCISKMMYAKGREEAIKESEDKPHSATLKVIVEAMKAGRERDVDFYFHPDLAIESLEKHLE